MYIARKTATWTKNKKGKNRGKRTEIPIEETFNFRETKKKKKRKSIKRPRRTSGATPSSSSPERVPSITVVRRLPFPYTQ